MHVNRADFVYKALGELIQVLYQRVPISPCSLALHSISRVRNETFEIGKGSVTNATKIKNKDYLAFKNTILGKQ